MKRKILLIVGALLISSVLMFGAFSASKIFPIRGSFTPNTSWTGGHPGKVLFDLGESLSGFTATNNSQRYLSGFFWLGNVGWSTFDHGISSCVARVVCPSDILSRPNQACPVHGCAWSQNAGWIYLSGSIFGTSTGVYFNPKTALIEGWGWSHTLGWVPFYAKTDSEIAGNVSLSGITMDGIGVNFIGKIAILGNIAGDRIFEIENEQSVGYVFTTATHASIINKIRQNIALISRNIGDTDLADENSNHNFLIKKNGDYETSEWGYVWPVKKRTIIVVGHDIVLDTSDYIGSYSDNIPRALIALKDNDGNGGNIIISEDVQRIYSMLYAEGAIYSGYKSSTGLIVPYILDGAFNIPARQLYIKGLLISKNTIGGARQDPYICPVTVDDCDRETAEKYDLNYFRTFDPNNPLQRSAPSSIPIQASGASVIIDYNPSILSDPPPGLVDVIQ